MIRFSIDYLCPKTFYEKLDYSNRIILSSTSDTLFVYNSKTNKYEYNACIHYETNGKEYFLKIRDDIYYYDGVKVGVDDYVFSMLSQKKKIPDFFENIDLIENKNNCIYIKLKYKDSNLINKLSYYLFSPHFNKTCGKYYILNITKNKITLAPNLYYRNKAIGKLEFIVCNNMYKDTLLFERNITDINNNTFLYLNDKNYKNEKSGIIFSLELSTKFSKRERKHLIQCINKNNIIKNLGDSYFVKNDFFFDEIVTYKYKKINKIKIDKELNLVYNEFYPNYEIASLIKKELEKSGYKINLIKLTYDEFKENLNYDLKLTLNNFEYIDNLYFYKSGYFKYIMKNDFIYNFLLKHGILFRFLNLRFKSKYIKEPIMSFYSSYNTNKYTKDFSYLECNYDKIHNK